MYRDANSSALNDIGTHRLVVTRVTMSALHTLFYSDALFFLFSLSFFFLFHFFTRICARFSSCRQAWSTAQSAEWSQFAFQRFL